MKKILISIFVLLSLNCTAQNVKVDSKGNYVATTNLRVDSSQAKETGKTYTDRGGKVYPVYISDKGKLFVEKISKTGNKYKMYLKLN